MLDYRGISASSFRLISVYLFKIHRRDFAREYISLSTSARLDQLSYPALDSQISFIQDYILRFILDWSVSLFRVISPLQLWIENLSVFRNTTPPKP
jgi:hypothetical protein